MDKRKGFSLMEVVIVIAIAASFIVVVSSLSNNATVLNNLVSQELQSRSDVAQALQVMTTEIRSASAAQNGAYPLNAAASSSFSFYTDIKKNGTIERVRYFYSSSTVWKGIIYPTGSPATYPTSTETVVDIIDNVTKPTTSTPLFAYYDSSYAGTQSPLSAPFDIATVRLVQIAFSTDIKTQQAPGPQAFSIFVDLRNLRSN